MSEDPRLERIAEVVRQHTVPYDISPEDIARRILAIMDEGQEPVGTHQRVGATELGTVTISGDRAAVDDIVARIHPTDTEGA